MEVNKRTVIYTAIFGPKDKLLEPEVKPEGFDFVCFTDQDFTSKIWDIRKSKREYNDPTRDARKRKVLVHEYLPEYETSIWIDGNIIVRGNPQELIDTYLKDASMAIYDKRNNAWDPGDCVYGELENLLELGRQRGVHKDDPLVMQEQVGRYRKEGYPEHNGMIISMIMIRRHRAVDVQDAMNVWWTEIEKGSKRDQLSFNYSAWKTRLKFAWLPGDSRDNEYFKHVYHPEHRKTIWRRILDKIKLYATNS